MSISKTSPPFVLRFTGLGTTVWYFVSSIFLPLPPKAFTASLSFGLALKSLNIHQLCWWYSLVLLVE
jgi:hypothetical protein